MTGNNEERQRQHRLFMTIHEGFVAGDFEGLTEALASPRWFDEELPLEFGGGHALVYAIYWSPVPFIARMIDAGATVNFVADDGFPALLAALSRGRPNRHEVLALLLERGADTSTRGINDWTALHHAVSIKDLEAVRMLLAARADASLRTRIDQCSTPLEDAQAIGFAEGAALLEGAR